MKTITLFLGKSGAGKDYLMKQFLKDNPNTHPIVSVTTRPPRPNEINGVDYWFVDDMQFEVYKLTSQLIECREYETEFGTWKYGTLKIINAIYDEYIGVVDISGAIKIINEYKDNKNVLIKCFYVTADDEIRKNRASSRGGFNLDEWNRRLATDEIDFSNEKLNELNNILLKYYGNGLEAIKNG